MDNVNAEAFGPFSLTNVTQCIASNSAASLTGSNTQFPIVSFDGKAHIGYKTRMSLGANSPMGSLFIKGLQWFNTPSGSDLIYPLAGQNVNAAIDVSINSSNAVTISLRKNNGLVSRIRTGRLAKGVSYDLIVFWDQRNPDHTTGVDIWVNDTSQTANSFLWKGNPSFTTTYSVPADYRFAKSSGSVRMEMELGAFWFMPGMRIPASDFGKFKADQIGSLGEGVTGSRPPIFMVGNAEQWNSRFGMNRGMLLPMFKQTESGLTDVNGSAWSI